LQAPLVRGVDHSGIHRGTLTIGPLPEPGFLEGLFNINRDVEARFAVNLSVPPESVALTADFRKYFTTDPFQQNAIFSPYPDPVRVLHDRPVIIPLRVAVPLSFQLTAWQWFRRA